VRHGDRTPKQKLKVKTKEPLILQYFHKHCNHPTKDLKVKAKAPMTEFLATVKAILASIDKKSLSDRQAIYKLRHMRDILERWKITGLNRKLQIKPRAWKEDEETGLKSCTEAQLILKWGGNLTKLGET
jgi:inositol hexakisphosphate/diphosphoinositol-pentakisphosphate kinase